MFVDKLVFPPSQGCFMLYISHVLSAPFIKRITRIDENVAIAHRKASYRNVSFVSGSS